MRVTASILLAVAVATGAFAVCGMFTDWGRRNFDEMADIIPFAAGVLSLVMLGAGVVLMGLSLLLVRRRRGFVVDPRGHEGT